MRARRLSKRVQIWQTENVPSQFGGYLVKDYQITDSWAEVTTLSDNSKYNSRNNDFGITDRHNSIIVKMRKRNDITYNSINQYLVFQGVKYMIAVQPTDTNFDNDSIVLIATRESIKEVAEILPISNDYLATRITQEYLLRVAADGGGGSNETCLYNYVLSLL